MNLWRMITAMILLFSPINKVDAQPVQRYDVVITELMADPDPPVNLPAVEYVELLNRSGAAVLLNGWTLSDQTATGAIQGNILLEPGRFLLLCAASNVVQLLPFGETAGVTRFPSLDNAGDILQLKDAGGATIHALSYSTAWYKEDFKKNGGWSLEMIDTTQPCLDIRTGDNTSRNWCASLNPEGGSPGKAGEVMKQLPVEIIRPLHSFMTNELTIVVEMSMGLDTTSIEPYYFTETTTGLNPVETRRENNWNEAVHLHFAAGFTRNDIFRIDISGIRGCNGRVQEGTAHLLTALPAPQGKEDILLNEILFNPLPPVEDYVELYNKGPAAVDLSGMYLGGKNTAGAATLSDPLCPSTRLLFPGEYVVFSPSPASLALQYIIRDSTRLLPLKSMPSYPDDKGTVQLYNKQGTIVDEVSYNEQWHHKLLSDREGVPLERIFTGRKTDDRNNWHSSAGTPGYRNAQHITEEDTGPDIFSLPYTLITPDADGHQDVLLLEYRFHEPGWILNVQVFDIAGRLVKKIARQFLAGTDGLLKWDGVADSGKSAPTGHYLLHVQYFHATGKLRHWKKTISIYGR